MGERETGLEIYILEKQRMLVGCRKSFQHINSDAQILDELTDGNAIISTGVGQHQMWAAQHYKYNRPRQWLTSDGLGAMGFGLPAAIGAAVARPDAVVVDIDGDWEDRFYKSNWGHTYLGNPAKEREIFLDMLKFAEACDIRAARVSRKDYLWASIQKILDTAGPYLLDVTVPHQEHVLPMIPSGGAFKDVITEGDWKDLILMLQVPGLDMDAL
ncbi:acetolactate synthase 1, chloroplastic-like [Primulina tabacum]|uniref:acetolactate synthase 1, chloroplastic-like n=1 Tax=Primulina tabacum TaxID=48773 RepID=UPI003F5A7DFF